MRPGWKVDDPLVSFLEWLLSMRCKWTKRSSCPSIRRKGQTAGLLMVSGCQRTEEPGSQQRVLRVLSPKSHFKIPRESTECLSRRTSFLHNHSLGSWCKLTLRSRRPTWTNWKHSRTTLGSTISLAISTKTRPLDACLEASPCLGLISNFSKVNI